MPSIRAPAGKSMSTDGPAANPPRDLDKLPDAVPRLEPIRPGGANKPYAVAGHWYEPITDERAYSERGLGSWYGRKYHGRPTASGEPYDMFAMTAAHPRLPIPSYARVRNPANGREIIVRINDRGPFVRGYAIDLSYTAALKLGLLRGVAPVEVERITPAMIRAGNFGSAEIEPTGIDLARPVVPDAADDDVIGHWLLEQEATAAGPPPESPVPPAPQR
ncbi:MAG: septal ring lytic transglycosylase RlpA family protein [Leptothrix sp. (in: b-proteobacteria)]